mgnify:CR=1 FL=1
MEASPVERLSDDLLASVLSRLDSEELRRTASQVQGTIAGDTEGSLRPPQPPLSGCLRWVYLPDQQCHPSSNAGGFARAQ